MAGIGLPANKRTVLGTMNVKISNFKIPESKGFTKALPVGQYYVIKNNETGEFDTYNGNTEKPTYPKIIRKAESKNSKVNFKAESTDMMNLAKEKLGEEKLPHTSINEDEYSKYYQKKQEHFARWIYDYYKEKVTEDSAYELPNFICFGRRLADVLVTPCAQTGTWDFHAAKFKKSIFFWADPNFYKQRRKSHPNENRHKYGHAFEALITGKDLSTSPMDLLCSKPLAVHERKFGNRNHSLLLVSDIDAEDDQANWVELKMYQKNYLDEMDNSLRKSLQPSEKALSCWSQCVAAGAERVIIGQSEDGCVTDIRVRDLQGFVHMANITQPHINLCYYFLDNFLDFVSKQFQEKCSVPCLLFLWDSTEEVKLVEGKQKQIKINRKVKCLEASNKEIPEWLNELCKDLRRIDDLSS